MDLISVLLGTDIVLDEDKFKKASDDFATLSVRLQTLNNDIEDMLNTLQEGFDTPAGRKFVSSCRKNLRQPMSDQKKVLEHISSTLIEVREMYSSVFREYDNLNTAIRTYNHDS